jgi:hypothetical protein
MKTSRIVLAAVVALALIVGHFSNASAQTYKRHALIEEGTGTWCHACPPGAWCIDSLEHHFANAVAISWHGPSGEPMYLMAMDTLATYAEVSGYPWAVVGRVPFHPNGSYAGYPNPWTSTALNLARIAPNLDFRIVNPVFSGNAVDFDIDITPTDLSKLATEDTATYVTVAVLTEDGIVMPQQWDNPASGVQETDEGFVHHNVARAVAGKILGDAIVVTKATAWPIRRHYHMVTSGSNSKIDVIDSVRIKTFIALKSKKSGAETYVEADQTDYVTKLPNSAQNAVWLVTPVAKKSYSSDSARIPLVWSKGGSVTAVKLEYSIDNGTTWSEIVASTSAQPYEWTLPADVFGKDVMVRVTDAANASTTFSGPTFSFEAKPDAAISVFAPKTGDSLLVGSKYTITFNVAGPVSENFSIDYSTDGKATWNNIKTGATTHSVDWTVPMTSSTQAAIRVTDGTTTGMTGTFSIVDSGRVTGVTVQGAPAIPVGTSSAIMWSATGFLGEYVDLDYFEPVQGTFVPLVHGLPATTVAFPWDASMMPTKEMSGYYVRVKYASGAWAQSDPFAIGAASGVVAQATDANITLAPNPLSSSATLRFDMTDAANVTLIVRDLLGREVLRLAPGTLSAGPHELTLDGAKLSAGSYEYVLVQGTKSYVGKMSIVR